LAEPRLGRLRGRGARVVAQHAEQPAHLGEREPCGVADGAQPGGAVVG
jgi:hypothetical protein